MDITSLISTAVVVLLAALGIAVMIVLAIVPAWMRYEAEHAEAAETPAGPPRRRPVPDADATPRRDGHALAA